MAMASVDVQLDQPSLPGLCPVTDAVLALSQSTDVDKRGAVYTRREVVDFMLDLAGYTPDQPLHRTRLLEPSFGSGSFLIPAIERLLSSHSQHAKGSTSAHELAPCIRAVELHASSYEQTRAKVIECIVEHGLSKAVAHHLADQWLVLGDFLLVPMEGQFDHVIGNPPYVRQELIPPVLLDVYRRRYSTLFDRADLYIPFFERSLQLLRHGGRLCLICSDRWTKNRYGAPLRALISEGFHLRAYVDMTDTNAFHSDVAAYPAITLIQRGISGPTMVTSKPPLQVDHLADLAATLRGGADEARSRSDIARIDEVARGSEPWVLTPTAPRDLMLHIESRFPSLEDAGCKVGIGVATGADKVYIGKFEELDVEDDRKLPIALTKDLIHGHIRWSGHGVINPFADSGALVDLSAYPRLAAYLQRHREQICGRHVARRDPGRWFRTIDRITPELASRPKLLIPDIKGAASIVLESGWLYPHHNLYHVTTETWNLQALQAVLMSNVTRLFIESYSTRMRGGFLRYQAQYLRRLRLPLWDDVSPALRDRLAAAAAAQDVAACNAAAAELYGLSETEQRRLTA